MPELRETARASGACSTARGVGQGAPGRVGKQFQEQPSTPIVGSTWNDSSRGLEFSPRLQGPYRPLASGLSAGACDGIYCQLPRHLPVLWSCLAEHRHLRFSRETANRVAEDRADHPGSALFHDRVSALPRKNIGQRSCRIRLFAFRTSADGFSGAPAAEISFERKEESRASRNAHRRCRKCFHGHVRSGRASRESGDVFALPGSQSHRAIFGNRLDQRDWLALRKQARLALGGKKPGCDAFSNRSEAQWQCSEGVARLVLGNCHVGSLDCLRHHTGRSQAALLQPPEAGFSEADRPGNGCRKPGSVGAARNQTFPGTVAPLQTRPDKVPEIRVFHEVRSRPIQAASAKRNDAEGSQGCRPLQKYQAQFEVALDVRDSSGSCRADQQLSRKSPEGACHLAKSLARKQNRTGNNLRATPCECRLDIEAAWTECHGLFGAGRHGAQQGNILPGAASKSRWISRNPFAQGSIAFVSDGDHFVSSENSSPCFKFDLLNTYKFNYFSSRFILGPKAVQIMIKMFLAPIWYFLQLLAPLLDILDRNWIAETSGYWVVASK